MAARPRWRHRDVRTRPSVAEQERVDAATTPGGYWPDTSEHGRGAWHSRDVARTATVESSPQLCARPGSDGPTSPRIDGEEEGSAMIPAQFDYVRPGDLDEALRILTEREGEAKILSGGYSLIPLIKLRLAQPGLLVDISQLSGLDAIQETDDELRIGARATHRQIHEHPIIQDRYPGIVDLAGVIGDPQVRNWGTIGGSVAHADPASDWPALLLAANATIVCRGTTGEREIPARDFFLDTFQTAIEPTEVLTEVRLPRRAPSQGGAYTKLERKVGDFATAGSAVVVKLQPDGTIAHAGVGLTAVAGCPFAATDAEAILVGQMPSEALFRRAGDAAGAQASPAGDIRGPVDYKRAMASELTVRSLRSAVARALSFA
jgi:carbon-monoxide dehydrogenase medium subunit